MTKFINLSLVIAAMAILSNQTVWADVLAGPVAADLYKNGNIASGGGDFTGSELFGGSGGAGAGAGTMSTPQVSGDSPLVMKEFTATESTTDLTLATCTENPAGSAAEEVDIPDTEWSYNPNDRPEMSRAAAPATLMAFSPPPRGRNFNPPPTEENTPPVPPDEPPTPPVTPEPATMLILLSGCVGLATTLRYKAQKTKKSADKPEKVSE